MMFASQVILLVQSGESCTQQWKVPTGACKVLLSAQQKSGIVIGFSMILLRKYMYLYK
jgi:hypothetical protein